MTPARKRNLLRLLTPRRVAVIGGRDAETVVGECRRIGYSGELWAVNPRRDQIAGIRCYPSVADLPDSPDAVFLAVPRAAAIETTKELRDIGAGGLVCYTAGFGELGGEGAQAEQALVDAAGDLAVVGPNCYGLINYLDRVALWPFAHGGDCPGYGAAIVTQSGMLASDLTMSQRSVPFACLISAGNQAQLAVEDFIDALLELPGVRVIGLHIEGLKNVERFALSAERAADANVPLVALKTGSSAIGAKLTVSHTGSLAGTDELYGALFDKLGVVRVDTPAQLLETLKYMCIAGVPKSNRVAAFTCSGGGATMLADYAEKIGILFPQPSERASVRLRRHLPAIATVSNPLDYTTPIWGDAQALPPVLNAMFEDDYDAALLVQDYPAAGLDESKISYRTDAHSFVDAARAAAIPAAVCSTLPENLDRETRELLVREGVAPMQGIRETLDALNGALTVAHHRAAGTAGWRPIETPIASDLATLDEWQAKRCLLAAGVDVPEGRLVSGPEVAQAAAALGYPVVLKRVDANLVHKTESGTVRVGLMDAEQVASALAAMPSPPAGEAGAARGYLVERMLPAPVAELLVGIRRDADFGFSLTLASGGVLAELIGDAVTILLPAGESELIEALACLKLKRLLDGFRGAPPADMNKLLHSLHRLADYARRHAQSVAEIEINPLFVMRDSVWAVDALMRVDREAMPDFAGPVADNGSL